MYIKKAQINHNNKNTTIQLTYIEWMQLALEAKCQELQNEPERKVITLVYNEGKTKVIGTFRNSI